MKLETYFLEKLKLSFPEMTRVSQSRFLPIFYSSTSTILYVNDLQQTTNTENTKWQSLSCSLFLFWSKSIIQFDMAKEIFIFKQYLNIFNRKTFFHSKQQKWIPSVNCSIYLCNEIVFEKCTNMLRTKIAMCQLNVSNWIITITTNYPR
jgi:hypothetical protein